MGCQDHTGVHRSATGRTVALHTHYPVHDCKVWLCHRIKVHHGLPEQFPVRKQVHLLTGAQG